MVVLAASIVTKSGKALVSRQYMDMSRIRIEGLLAAFPKLVGSGKQHTYVETENVRYVYQPMEGLYLLLVTNRNSNILEDLDTLRLLSKLVPEYAGAQVDEEGVGRAAFDLIFAFDEVISNGHKENITAQQVKANCEMESHEEKLHKMIIQSKINETKDVMKRKANEIEKARIIDHKRPGVGAMGGMAGGGYSPALGGSRAAAVDMDVGPSLQMPALGGFGAASAAAAAGRPGGIGVPKKGMQLGKAKGASSMLESLAKEEGVANLDAPVVPRAGAGPGPGPMVISDPVHLNIEEKLTVVLNKQGGLDSLEVQGTMSLVVGSDADAFVAVHIRAGANNGFQFKTHPNIDKAAYSANNVLGLKDPSRPFPTGSELGILKWRFTSRDEDLVPITINCWPSASGADSYVNIEYESAATYDLQHVTVTIPLPHTSHAPTVNQIDGEWRYDARSRSLVWSIDLIDDTNRSGSMEFVVPAADPESFYPVEVSFTATQTLCDIDVEQVVNTQSGGPVKYGHKRQLVTFGYHVV